MKFLHPDHDSLLELSLAETIYLALGRESVDDILVGIYTGVQTRAGFIEGTPHGKVRNA